MIINLHGVGGSNPSLLTIFTKMEKTIRETRQIVIDQILNGLDLSNKDILEPSAGKGHLVEGILKAFPKVKSIDCVELNKENREILFERLFNVVGNDFLKFETNRRYDYVIAAPTYKNNVDVEHIMHMYKFLRVGGQIVSLTYPEWTIKNNENQVLFRKWLEDKDYSMRMLKDNSFVENHKTQPSVIITIKKTHE